MKRYKIIYADPPWEFKNWNDDKALRGVCHKYPLMTDRGIESLDIASIADKDSVLLMWATFPKLEAALWVIGAWGYTYKTCAFVWVKKNKTKNTPFMGMGYYTRANAELCLLATKGRPLPRLVKNVGQIIESPIESHSRKPAIVRDKIVELFGDLPRIELFAREKVPGWDVFGNEVESDIIPGVAV